jgi:hypothetical protein
MYLLEAPLLVACCVMIAGCGQSGGPDPGGRHRASSEATESRPVDAGQSSASENAATLDARETQRFAEAVNLTASDVPEYTVEKLATQKHAFKESAAGTQLVRCAGGIAPSRTLAEYSSATFRRQIGPAFEQVHSSVSAMPTAAMADADLSAAQRMKGSCATKAFDGHIKPTLPGEEIAPFKFARIATGAPGAFGFTVTTTVSAAGHSVPLRIDVLGFVTGSTEVSFSTLAMSLSPDPATGARLFRDLMIRAQHYPGEISRSRQVLTAG